MIRFGVYYRGPKKTSKTTCYADGSETRAHHIRRKKNGVETALLWLHITRLEG